MIETNTLPFVVFVYPYLCQSICQLIRQSVCLSVPSVYPPIFGILTRKVFFRAAWKALLARYGRFSTTDSSSSVWDVAFPWAGLCWPHHLLWCKRLVVESSFLLLLLLFLFFKNSGIVAICLTKFVNRERKNILKSTQKWGAGRVQTHLYFCFLF